MKHFKCPKCVSASSVIRKTKRGKSIRYFCKSYITYFSIATHWNNARALLSDHLDGYILKRRFTKYTDCRGKFKYTNGKTGVQMTKKERVIVPLYF